MSITLEDVKILDNKILYKYSTSVKVKDYFNFRSEFFIEYSLNISTVPLSILVIPFITNALPLSWLLDETIIIPEIDYDFYCSIDLIKKGYIKMYPMLKFKGNIVANKVVKNANFNKCEVRSLSFFSGGVDSYNTLLRHIDEKPILVTMWGSDITLEDHEGWKNISNLIDTASNIFNLKHESIKSNFRYFLNAIKLSQLVKKSNDGWWHGFQHGIGIAGHAAPVAWLYNSPSCYIASTRSKKDLINLTCASHPDIEGQMHFAATKVVHDGFEENRQDKIKNIVEYSKISEGIFPLHVCWQSRGG